MCLKFARLMSELLGRRRPRRRVATLSASSDESCEYSKTFVAVVSARRGSAHVVRGNPITQSASGVVWPYGYVCDERVQGRIESHILFTRSKFRER